MSSTILPPPTRTALLGTVVINNNKFHRIPVVVRLQQRRGDVNQRTLAHVRVPPSMRGRSPKLTVSYPHRGRDCVVERQLAHALRDQPGPPSA
jgi:hypothetical protein